MSVSLYLSISETVILRASPLMITRPPCLARGLLARVIASSIK